MEEKEIRGHKERVIEATHQVLLEVFKILKDFRESLILVGGWVPIMIIPESEDKYVGTIDVDLVINDKYIVQQVLKQLKIFCWQTVTSMGPNWVDTLKKLMLTVCRYSSRWIFLPVKKDIFPRMNFLTY